MEDEMEICSNCKREIPSINYVMHSMHCHRNIAVCPKCKEPVPRSELAEHDQTEHSSVPCKACGKVVESSQMSKHEAETCPHRRVTCVYCELDLGAEERSEHENYCGSRTEKCEECGEFVMLKYRGLHLDSNHGFIKLTDEPGPSPSWEPPVATPALTSPLRSILKNPMTRSTATVTSTQLAKPVPKVPNVERVTTEPKRPSPVKRDNHQPQVNTTQPVTEKAVTTGVSEMLVDEDADRLLALRLAREEAMQHHPFSAFHVPAARLPALSPRTYMTDSDDDEELAAALMTRPARRARSPEPRPREPSPVLPMLLQGGDTTPVAEEAEVELPCEFCTLLVPASRLVLHQTGCRPDLARFRPRRRSPPSAILAAPTPVLPAPSQGLSMLHNDLQGSSTSPPSPPPRFLRKHGGQGRGEEEYSKKRTDLIPCDLCGSSVPADNFMQHQLACEIHHLPGRTTAVSRPQALVMPLSGRALRVRAPAPELPPPSPPPGPPAASKNLLQEYAAEKTTRKQPVLTTEQKYTRTNLGGALDTASSRPVSNGPVRPQPKPSSSLVSSETRGASSGAVPKQKAGRTRSQGQIVEEIPGSSSPSRSPLGGRSSRSNAAQGATEGGNPRRQRPPDYHHNTFFED